MILNERTQKELNEFQLLFLFVFTEIKYNNTIGIAVAV